MVRTCFLCVKLLRSVWGEVHPCTLGRSDPDSADSVFTVELGIQVQGIGHAGLDEDLVVTDQTGRFLCNRQLELVVI